MISSSNPPRLLNKTACPGAPGGTLSLAANHTLWLASDIHLGAGVPRTNRAFYDFLALARQQAQGLILCGDIFDAWIGDDHALKQPPVWLAEALDELRLTAQAIPLWLMHGNRDFLLGQKLAQALGARLLAAPCRLDTCMGPILLAHGDEYCTDDISYQRFRRVVRTRWVQRVFLALPLAWRRAIAHRARARSRQAHSDKPMQIMDVSPDTIIQALRMAHCTTLIHGHTHRPAMHALEIDGQAGQRHVLPDWEFDHVQPPCGGWISISAAGIQAHAWPPKAAPKDH